MIRGVNPQAGWPPRSKNKPHQDGTLSWSGGVISAATVERCFAALHSCKLDAAAANTNQQPHPKANGNMSILTTPQIAALHAALAGRLISVCFGAGVDSTAMLIALKLAGIRPDVITFANMKAEKTATMLHIDRINNLLSQWGWPPVSVCAKVPLVSTGYNDLYGNCMKNETLPSLAFGKKSCSIKWKQVPQDQFLMGAKRGPNKCEPHPVWIKHLNTGQKIVKLIGYDAGIADMRRAKNLPFSDQFFDYYYPLQMLGWTRADCIHAITDALGADMVPFKSACFFCPASKQWELYWLAAHQPELLEMALVLERNALTGRHSRFDKVEFGSSWEEMVLNADRFPSSKTTVGLGRSFAWNQWARVNDVVDENFKVKRHQVDRDRFIFLSKPEAFKTHDNSLDRRNFHPVEVIVINPV